MVRQSFENLSLPFKGDAPAESIERIKQLLSIVDQKDVTFVVSKIMQLL